MGKPVKVVVVVPRFARSFGEFQHFPIGLGYIASVLKEAGHDVKALNLNHHFGAVSDLVADFVGEHGIEVCATGGLSPHLNSVENIFAGARRANPDIKNICGGGLVSSDPDIAPDLMDIEVGVIGEGEGSIVEVVDAFRDGSDLADIAGIVFRDVDGKIVRTQNRPAIMDLGTIPWPDYDLMGIKKHLEKQSLHDNYFFECQPDGRPRAIEMVSSRSCPFSCTFCFHPIGKVYRERPLDDFFAELEFLIEKYQVNMVIIVDELFSLRKARLHEFCERIKPYGIQWMVQLHVSSVDDETLKAMRESGSPVISYGVESMSQPVLDSMQKKTKKERIEKALALTYKHRIGVRANLIYGDTAETVETANESMGWWAENLRYQITAISLQVFPGSPDYIMAIRDGLINDRLSFARELPVHLNISNVSRSNMNLMVFLLNVYRKTILRPIFETEFRVSENQIPGRDIAYDLDWTCPRCDHHNAPRGLIIKSGSLQSAFIRVYCVSCRTQWDLENKIRGRTPFLLDLESPADAQEAADIEADPSLYWSKVEDATSELEEYLKIHADKKREKYTYKRETRSTDELKKSGWDLIQEPFDAPRHIRFAHFLGTEKLYGGCAMHLRQAILLDPTNETYKGYLQALEKSAEYEEKKHAFFKSVSDEAPVFRASRQTGEYNRKKEPDFPVYSRAGNRASIAPSAAE